MDITKLLEAPGLRYGVFSFPFVKLYLAGNDRFLAMAAFAGTPDAEALTRALKRGTALSVDAALAFLRAYMNGVAAPLPVMDMGPYTEKEKAIYRELVKVKFGSTLSYGELAARAGLPRAGRFAGNAMAKNLFPVLVPCHRVIRGDGRPGNYTGGVDIKLNLLAHEGVAFGP
ncbi:MAG TPA: methylated-DNA--[protein]-cysteine S-methyltransferase [Spirochaetes bacterium]|nr:methylated-DNA--[protein]-cysteine S-methyltransferase [Spirochaetota bacterium]